MADGLAIAYATGFVMMLVLIRMVDRWGGQTPLAEQFPPAKVVVLSLLLAALWPLTTVLLLVGMVSQLSRRRR